MADGAPGWLGGWEEDLSIIGGRGGGEGGGGLEEEEEDLSIILCGFLESLALPPSLPLPSVVSSRGLPSVVSSGGRRGGRRG